MKPIARLYLKFFLFTGIPFGLLMTVFDIVEGKGFQLWEFLYRVGVFGGVLSLLFVSYHWYGLKKKGIKELTDDILRVRQSQHLVSGLSREELIDRLKQDPIFGKMKMMETTDGILLTSGMTWKSWGEEIKIRLSAMHGDQFEYDISSSPLLKTTLVDYGANLQNVRRVVDVIGGAA